MGFGPRVEVDVHLEVGGIEPSIGSRFSPFEKDGRVRYVLGGALVVNLPAFESCIADETEVACGQVSAVNTQILFDFSPTVR